MDAEAVKVELGLSRPLPRIPQYHRKPEGLKRFRSIIQGLLNKKLLVLTSSPRNIPILAVKKPHGQRHWLVQDLRSINKVVKPRFTLEPNPNAILSAFLPAPNISWPRLMFCLV